VAVYDSPEINAFATGMKSSDALVAVSTGLLSSMSRDEAEQGCGAGPLPHGWVSTNAFHMEIKGRLRDRPHD